MYGSWFGVTFGAVVVVAALIGLSVLASPLIGVLVALVVIGAIAGLFIARRGAERSGGGSQAPAAGRSAFEGGPAAPPRSGGEPASGEGHAGSGETAGRP